MVSRWLEIGVRCSLLKVRSILLRFLDADDAYEPGALEVAAATILFSARYVGGEISIKTDKFSQTLCRTP